MVGVINLTAMRKMYKYFTAFVAFTLALSSCRNDSDVSIKADFTFDKEVFDIYEEIVPRYAATCTGASVDVIMWEWGDANFSLREQMEEPLVFDTPGNYPLKLTVVTDNGIGDTCTKDIVVMDKNVPPTASFSYAPSEIRAGESIKFTSTSTDPEGKSISCKWYFGDLEFTGDEVDYIFAKKGENVVSLVVCDERGAKDSLARTLSVLPSLSGIDVIWESGYGTSEGEVIYSSPAMSPDGNSIYVYSSDYQLYKFDLDGKVIWSFDCAKYGSTASIAASPSVTPSVADDGTIYVAAGYGMQASAGKGCVLAINPDGTEKWHVSTRVVSYGYITPAVCDDYLFMISKGSLQVTDFVAYNRNTGAAYCSRDLSEKNGSLGGYLATKEAKVYVTTSNTSGDRIPGAGFVYFKEAGTSAQGENWWKFYGSSRDSVCLGFNKATRKHEIPGTASPAMASNGNVYFLFKSHSGAVSSSSVLYAFDNAEIKGQNRTHGYHPIWVAPINGETEEDSGTGIVTGPDGTIYVTTSGTGSCITAVSASGLVLWEYKAEGGINGSAAVGSDGNIYFTDCLAGKIVCLNSEGKCIGSMALGTKSLASSPAMAPDGTLYVNGVKGTMPVLLRISSSSKAPAAGWSQLGGGFTKNPCRY